MHWCNWDLWPNANFWQKQVLVVATTFCVFLKMPNRLWPSEGSENLTFDTINIFWTETKAKPYLHYTSFKHAIFLWQFNYTDQNFCSLERSELFQLLKPLVLKLELQSLGTSDAQKFNRSKIRSLKSAIAQKFNPSKVHSLKSLIAQNILVTNLELQSLGTSDARNFNLLISASEQLCF